MDWGHKIAKPSTHTICQHPSRRPLAKGEDPRPATASPGPKGPLSQVGLAFQQSKLGLPCDAAQHAVVFMHQSDRGSLDAYPSVKTPHSNVTAGSDKVGVQSEGARHGEVHDPATLKAPCPHPAQETEVEASTLACRRRRSRSQGCRPSLLALAQSVAACVPGPQLDQIARPRRGTGPGGSCACPSTPCDGGTLSSERMHKTCSDSGTHVADNGLVTSCQC